MIHNMIGRLLVMGNCSKLTNPSHLRHITRPLAQPTIQLPTSPPLLKLIQSFSGRKLISKPTPKVIPNQSSNNRQPIDIESLPVRQQLPLILQSIHEEIASKQDTESLMQLIQRYSDLLIQSFRLKDGLIQFDKIVNKMRPMKQFKRSPNFHLALAEFRYYLIRSGRMYEAVLVTKECIKLLEGDKTVESMHVASELSVLGILHFMNREYSQSRKALEKELKINLKLCDETYLETIECRNNLAIVDFAQGNYNIALQTFTKTAQISKRLMKSSKKRQVAYLKHFCYLQPFIMLSQTSQNQAQLTNNSKKLSQIHHQIQQILKNPSKPTNDLSLFYTTISELFLSKNRHDLSAIFARKAIKINQKKLDEPQLMVNRNTRTMYQLKMTQAKGYRVLGEACLKCGDYAEGQKTLLKAVGIFRKEIVSFQARQMLSLQTVEEFVKVCKLLFHLQFQQGNKQKASLQQAIDYIQTPFSVWSTIVENLWNPPNRILLIPCQINIQIAIKLLQLSYTEQSIHFLQTAITQIDKNQYLLCPISKTNLATIHQRIKSTLSKAQNITASSTLKDKSIFPKQLTKITALNQKLKVFSKS